MILSYAIWIPIFFGIIILFYGSERPTAGVRWLALFGAVLGFIGAGGAMLSVPILIYGFNFTPAHATTAALAIVFSAAVSGLISKFRSKDVLIKEALVIWSLGLVTNLGGSSIANHENGHFGRQSCYLQIH